MSDLLSTDNKKNDEFYFWLLFILLQQDKREWDCLREKEIANPNSIDHDYKTFFEKIFAHDIPTESVQRGMHLYRARHIQNKDISKLGVNINDLAYGFYKIILSDEDASKMSELNKDLHLILTYDDMILLQASKKKYLTEDQQKKVNEFIKTNSMPGIYGFNEKDSRVPPLEYRKSGRLNSNKDEYLYLAFDKATAVYEMRPSIGQQYSIAEFCTNKDLTLADLTCKDENVINTNTSLWVLADKISEPNTDNSEEFYHITQYMSHLLHKQGFDGIIYKSAINKGRNNILLFDESTVDFISSDFIVINDVSVDYSTILPFDNKKK